MKMTSMKMNKRKLRNLYFFYTRDLNAGFYMDAEVKQDYEDVEVTEYAGNFDALRKKDARDFDAEGIEDDLKVTEDAKKMDNFCNKDTRYSDARLYVDKEITEQYGDAEVTEDA